MLVYRLDHIGAEGPVYKGILTAKVGSDKRAEEAARRARKAQMAEAERFGQLKLGEEENENFTGIRTEDV